MMRVIRRALRQWKREFSVFWGRFTAFHRIVIGMLLAMAIVFGARSRLLDPLEQTLAAERKALADKSVPARVPLPEQDEVIAEETLRAENLQRSIENLTGELAHLEAASHFRLDASKADANAALLALASQRGLHVLKNTTVEPSPDGGVATVASRYELAGRFGGIYGFLDDMQRQPLLWQLRDVSIALLNEQDALSGGTPTLVLRFTLILHLYRGGGA